MNTDVVKLGEITSITKLAGFEFTKYFNYNQTGEIIALRALNLRNGKLDLTDIHRIDKSISDKLPRSKLYKGDILFTYTGNGYGDCALVDEDDKYHLAPNICKITSNQEKVDYTFLFYTIRSKSFYGQVSGFIGGSGQPTIPMERIRKLKIFLPKMQVQQKIANILSRYDEAIENNNKRIKLLEQMAQNLYKEWFVRFRFPGYENCEFENGIPVGWNFQKLEDFGIVLESGSRPSGGVDINLEEGIPSLGAECIKGLAEFDYSNIKYIPLEFYDKMKRGKNKGNHILLYKDGAYIGKVTLFRNQFPFKKYAINEHVFFLNSKNGNYLNWLFFTLKQDSYFNLMQNLNRNAAQPGLSQPDICRIKIRIPQEDIVIKFNQIVEPILNTVFYLAKANQNLAKQRDLLLPRLMSGKLEVN